MTALRILGAFVALLAPAAAFAQASPSPYTSAIRYDGMARVTGTIAPDPDGAGPLAFAAVRNSYDGDGRLIKVEAGELAAWQSEAVAPSAWSGFTIFRTLETSYDEVGRKTRENVRHGAAGDIYTVTQYSYDITGRPDCTAVRMNMAAFGSLPASACTLGSQGDHGPDRITRNVYNEAGERVQVREGVGTAIEAADATWAYNLNGQVTTVIDGNGNRAALRYDGYMRQDRWTFPSATRATAYNDATQTSALATAGAANAADYEDYAYDANGNRTNLRKRDGRNIVFAYDALNRGTSKTYPQGGATAVYYSYDLRGLQLSARFGSQSGEGIANAYDGFGRLASTTSDISGLTRTLSYQYDRNGNRTRITHPDGIYFTTGYDGLGRTISIADSASVRFLIGYTPHGGPGFVLRNNATQVIYGYGPLQRLGYIAMGHDFPGYTEDVFILMVHNPAGQISTLSRSNDAYAWTGHYAVNRPYTANGLNQYSAAGTASFTYDANGNLTSDGTNTYTYDIENRLVARSGGVALGYDPLGRLLAVASPTTYTRFLNDGDAVVAEYDGNNAMARRYVHNEGADVPLLSYAGSGLTQLSYLHADHQGSIVAVSNAAGASAINTYDEYGIPGASNTGRFQYTGQAWIPELGMYHYKARIYSPTLGRFLQTDPIGYQDQFNLYAYVGNDPVNMTDPSGQVRWKDGKVDYRSDIHRPPEMIYHEGGVRSFGRHVFIFADNGRAIEATRNEGVSPQMNTDCHGYTFANGEVWINNNMVDRLLGGDNYHRVESSQVRPGDIVVYRNGRAVQHSGIVASVEGGQVMITSKSGTEPQAQTRPVQPGPGGAWWNPRSTYTFHRQETPTNRPPSARPDTRQQY